MAIERWGDDVNKRTTDKIGLCCVLMLLGCSRLGYDLQFDFCLGVDCSEHGQCVERDGQATCLCDNGYLVVDDTQCVSRAAGCFGVDCSDHGRCIIDGGEPLCLCDTGYVNESATTCFVPPGYCVGAQDCDVPNPCLLGSCNGVGYCEYENVPDGDPCGELGVTACDGADRCESGICVANYVGQDTPCGDTSFCNGQELCDGYGRCLPGVSPCPGQACDDVNGRCVECLSDAECPACQFCDAGTSTCLPKPANSPCDETPETVCETPGACDGSGQCQLLGPALSDYDEIGLGTSEAPYVICTPEQFADIGASGCSNGGSAGCATHYVLGADLQMEGVSYSMIGDPDSNQFHGTIDGRSHLIWNLQIDASVDQAGMVRYLSDGGVLRNIFVENLQLWGDEAVDEIGGLVGAAEAVIIDNCHVTGFLDLCSAGTIWDVGGLVGSANGFPADVGLIEDSSFFGNITIRANRGTIIGGLIGKNNGVAVRDSSSGGSIKILANSCSYAGGFGAQHWFGSVSRVDSTMDVSGCSDTAGGLYAMFFQATLEQGIARGSVTAGDWAFEVGGLIGYLAFAPATVTDSYASGATIGGINSYGLGGAIGYINEARVERVAAEGSVICGDSSDACGGFVGLVESNPEYVADCYATGTVTMGDGSSVAGGFYGDCCGEVTSSYAVGRVSMGTGGSMVGGFGGRGSNCTHSANHWDTESSGVTDAYSGVTGSVAGQVDGHSTALMRQQATFSGWDFGVWSINEGVDYPRLQ